MSIQALLGNTDIYLIDQILKNTYKAQDKILDAGCGGGRNLHWFYQNDFDIYGVDQQQEAIEHVRQLYPKAAANFKQATLDQLPYQDHLFDHVLCSAVLHFAASETHFLNMFAELVRVLKPAGTLFMRMTSDFGIATPFQHLQDGVYLLHDNSTRFLLTATLLRQVVTNHDLELIEPLKTTNVSDLRCMSTLVFRKRE